MPARTALATAVFTFGVAAGALWEIAEWTTSVVFDVRVNSGLADALTDLIANSVGALVATLVALAVRERGGKLS